MKIGICRGLDDFDAIKNGVNSGVDYLETGFGCLANFTDEKFGEAQAYLKDMGLECVAANGFIPGEMKLVGNDVDYVALSEYIDRGFSRAGKLGVKTVVFGSGKARSFDEGFPLEKAKEQLAYFLSEYAAPRAEKAGAIIVMEPLRFCESTMIYTVSDGIEIAEMCGKNNVKTLADLYHVYGNEDSVDYISQCYGKVFHAHIAHPVTRNYPSINDEDEVKAIYRKFFDALKSCGCNTCSIEARTDDFSKDIVDAIKLIKDLI